MLLRRSRQTRMVGLQSAFSGRLTSASSSTLSPAARRAVTSASTPAYEAAARRPLAAIGRVSASEIVGGSGVQPTAGTHSLQLSGLGRLQSSLGSKRSWHHLREAPIIGPELRRTIDPITTDGGRRHRWCRPHEATETAWGVREMRHLRAHPEQPCHQVASIQNIMADCS